jgi:hypothetical protein
MRYTFGVLHSCNTLIDAHTYAPGARGAVTIVFDSVALIREGDAVMIGSMLILSAGLGLFILLGVAGKWRVEHDEKRRAGAQPPRDRGDRAA